MPIVFHIFLIFTLFSVLVEECEFYDDDVVYRFIFDIESPLPLHKALNLNEDEGCYMKGIEDYMKRISLDSDTKRKYLQLFWKGEKNIFFFFSLETMLRKAFDNL